MENYTQNDQHLHFSKENKRHVLLVTDYVIHTWSLPFFFFPLKIFLLLPDEAECGCCFATIVNQLSRS